MHVAPMNGVDVSIDASTGDGIAPYKSRLPTGGYAVSGAHMYSVQCGCINSHSEEKWETILGMAERNRRHGSMRCVGVCVCMYVFILNMEMYRV